MTQQITAALAALALGIAGLGAAAASDLYRVDAELRQDGVVLGTPSMRVRAGEAGRIEVDGAAGYAFTVTVTPDSAEAVRVEGAIATAGAAPEPFVMRVRPRQPATLDVGARAVALTVTPAADAP